MKKSHGLTTTREKKKVYSAWKDIKIRCYNKSHIEYKRYGACGINLQDTWINDPLEFYNYVSSLDNFSLDRSLDRIDNDFGYCEGNLRWATKAEQCRNQGKCISNTSGFTGITWYYNNTGGTRAIAWWYTIDGKPKSKSFPVKKFGLLPAFKMAVDCRITKIKELNAQGAGYSDKHGL